jgi:hypothetical protein
MFVVVAVPLSHWLGRLDEETEIHCLYPESFAGWEYAWSMNRIPQRAQQLRKYEL